MILFNEDAMRIATATLGADTKIILLMMFACRTLPYISWGATADQMDAYVNERGLLNEEGLRMAAYVCLLDEECTLLARDKAREILGIEIKKYALRDHIITTQDDGSIDWEPDTRACCKWGATGWIFGMSNRHGLCYLVEHEDGMRAWYNHGELRPA